MMNETTAEKAGTPVTHDELARLDYFKDLRDRYLSLDGLEARWHSIDRRNLSPSHETCMRLHYFMSLTRAVEEALDSAFRSGHIPGTAFFGRGNEAASVGSAGCLRDEEWLVPMHRNCGAHLVKGHPARSIMAHHFGRADGPSRGRDGNFHMGYRPKKITQIISHIGSMIPIAAGIAWAEKIRGTGRATLTYIGDGGTSSGDFHEGINFAAVHKLPVVFIIDNNQYAYKTLPKEQYACKSLFLRAPGYGIPGFLIDGTDVLLVHKICSEALDRARSGKGPTLIESVTMRLSGHSIYDKFADYVDMEDLRRWAEERDPLTQYDARLEEAGIATIEEISTSHARAREEAEAARDEALKSPFPDPGTVSDDVYAP
ncbi:MAG: thiamine pyrophosphate-dependent dehydrogenase E1 component subunit alpha [bacterium]